VRLRWPLRETIAALRWSLKHPRRRSCTQFRRRRRAQARLRDVRELWPSLVTTVGGSRAAAAGAFYMHATNDRAWRKVPVAVLLALCDELVLMEPDEAAAILEDAILAAEPAFV
jgi:hypothetical protein